MPNGGCVYVLIKNDEMEYKEGQLVSVGLPHVEAQKDMFSTRTVVDVTFSVDGTSYTDAAEINTPFLSTMKLGALAVVATDKETILQELRGTRNACEKYLKESETEIPKSKKRITRCDELIGKLDTAFAEKQAIENRFVKLEEQSSETHAMLKQILKKLDA